MVSVLSGGCAIDALYWDLAGTGMVGDQYRPDRSDRSDPAPCIEYAGLPVLGASETLPPDW